MTVNNESVTDKTESKIDHIEATDSSQASSESNTDFIKRYNRKLDIRILPFLFLLFFFSFLDRSNIGNAAIAGLQKDIHLSGNAYEIALGIFFVIYMLVELPAAWIFKWMGPRYFFSISIFCFGFSTIGLGFVRTASQLYAIRCLLGLFEGGLTPCLYIYMAMYYRRWDIQRRVCWFYIAAPLSSAFGGLIAAGAGKIQTTHYAGWPWIFFLCGMITVFVGFVCIILMPNLPAQCKFLTLAELRITAIPGDGTAQVVEDLEVERFSWRKAKQGLLDMNTLCIAFMSLGLYANVYAYALFSPTIIKSFGFSVIDSQLISVPPYILGCISVIVQSYLSDYTRLRLPYFVGSALVQAVGWILQLSCTTTTPRYFGLFLLTFGAYGAVPPMATLIINNVGPYYQRATATSICTATGTVGGIITSFTFVAKNKYQGSAIQLGLCVFTAIWACILMWWVRSENARRSRGERDYRLSKPEDQLGSRHPRFVLAM